MTLFLLCGIIVMCFCCLLLLSFVLCCDYRIPHIPEYVNRFTAHFFQNLYFLAIYSHLFLIYYNLLTVNSTHLVLFSACYTNCNLSFIINFLSRNDNKFTNLTIKVRISHFSAILRYLGVGILIQVDIPHF